MAQPDSAATARAAAELACIASKPERDLAGLLWASPFPASLQGADFRLVTVNAAYAELLGLPREQLIGSDPVELQPEEDRMFNLAARQRLREDPADPTLPALVERRLIDAHGRERWFRLSRRVLRSTRGTPLYLALLQDCTGEHVARDQADRAMRELDDWFDLAPTGMVLYDDTGLLVRSNRAFEALIGQVPVVLAEAAPALQQLLGWQGDAPLPDLQPGAPPLELHGVIALPDGRHQRLRARLRASTLAGSRRRVMAMVEDRSLEDERDQAQLEIGALADTAGVGVATFEEGRGWRPSLIGRADVRGGVVKSAGLESISSEIVEPESMAEYERLQRALKLGERTEVRYAVRHPQLGARWLLTRVEPGRLGSGGGRTTSVVTLDVTEQEQAQRRNAQLLRELTTILDGTSAGIAYLRGNTLVRCNERFERMIGAGGGKVAGASLEELFADAAAMRASLASPDAGGAYETEFQAGAQGTWYSLSVRRAAGSGPQIEAVAVLTDITRLKSQQAELEAAREQTRRQAERTRAILDSVLVGIVTVREGGIDWMNRSARRMFGGELADFVGEPIATVATPEADHPLRRTHYLHALAEGQAEAFECRLRGRDGREFWVVGNAVMTGHEDGSRQLTFALLDIERRRQAEVRIAQAQASLARIIETAPLAIGLLDARSLRVLQLNQMAATFAGRSIEQALNRPPEDLFDADFAAAVTADLRDALGRRDLVRRELRRMVNGQARVWDTRYVPLAAPGDAPDQVLIVASDVTEQRLADEARLQAAIAQRDMLVKEVHHRIKNNLQGVAGLMQQIAQRRPEVAPVISEAIGQVQAIAQVYGLQVGVAGPLRVRSVIEAIVNSVQRMFGRTIAMTVDGPAPQRWALPEAESIPIALTVNELLTNALKHSADPATEVRCALTCDDDGVQVEIANRARLPDGFELARVRGGVSGLGLVRALLPRRSATLALLQRGDEVVASIGIKPPGVTAIDVS